MRVFLTAVAYLVTLAVVAAAASFLAIVSTIHGEPTLFLKVTFVLGWITVFVVPVLVARLVWLRIGKRMPSNPAFESRPPSAAAQRER